MIVKKEIEIDLPDHVAEKWEPVAFRFPRNENYLGWDGSKWDVCSGDPVAPRLILAPKREPLVTRIARAVIAGKCGFTPVMVRIEWMPRWESPGWLVHFEGCSVGALGVCGPIPPHEPGDPETVLVSDINADVKRLRAEGGGV